MHLPIRPRPYRAALISFTISCFCFAAPTQNADRPLDARKLRFAATTTTDALAWQKQSRTHLLDLMKLSDLAKLDGAEPGRPGIAFNTKIIETKREDSFTRYEIEFNSTPTRRIRAIFTVPFGNGPFPAVVCIHGHGGNRNIVYDPTNIYRGFALRLAQRGYVTISTDVGQHEVYETGRTLMGERLWDVIRCVTYLTTRSEVDAKRMGCAGLSLGGEMTMWLGAMDTRIRATVSAGYLTTIANMRNGHCPCWEFPGLAENFDWPDIYSLIAPRALMCQIGQKERAPGGFPVDIAKQAWSQIVPCYRLFPDEPHIALDIHLEGHVVDLQPALEFLDRDLKSPTTRPAAD